MESCEKITGLPQMDAGADKRVCMADRIRTAARGSTHLFYTGQAGFILKSAAGTTVGIDLYLSDCVARFDGFKRLLPMLLSPGEIVLDCVVATHWHYDHFDIDSLPRLMANGHTRLLAADDCREQAERLGLDAQRSVYLEPGMSANVEDIGLTALFCDHGAAAPRAIGLAVQVDGKRLYFTGDTALRLDKADEIAARGPYDVMIAPINGAFGNLDERDAVTLCGRIGPGLIIPEHYWCFAEHHGDPGKFAELLRERLPGQKSLFMAPGERVTL